MKKLLLYSIVAMLSINAKAQEITFTNLSSWNSANGEVIPDVYNFGHVAEFGGRVSTVLEFVNTGNKPLIITSIRASCGCLVPTWTSFPIEPGKRGSITATYNPNGRPGRFSKTLTIISNEIVETRKVRVSGEVIAGVYAVEQDGSPNSNIAANTPSQTQNNSVRQNIPVTNAQPYAEPVKPKLSDIDENIPISGLSNNNTFVLIIANENYQFLDKVKFANNDGSIFREYCIKTLGIPERQIQFCPNATYGILLAGIDWLVYALNNFENSNAIVYYCGHGIPDEKTRDAYLIPTDGNGTNTATCYGLNTLYKVLSQTKSNRITYLMDACFTGANKDGSMLVAARGVAREAKKEVLMGKSIVFSAASADETAMTYEERQHGLFTYFLLKKIRETNGKVTYKELADYISQNVKKEAFLINNKPQNPIVGTSPAAASEWEMMTF